MPVELVGPPPKREGKNDWRPRDVFHGSLDNRTFCGLHCADWPRRPLYSKAATLANPNFCRRCALQSGNKEF